MAAQPSALAGDGKSAPMISFDQRRETLLQEGRPFSGAGRCPFRCPAGRVRQRGRPQWVREVHAAQSHRRADGAFQRQRGRQRFPGDVGEYESRLRDAGRHASPLAHRTAEHRYPLGASRWVADEQQGRAGQGNDREGRSGRLSGSLPRRAVRWHAQTGDSCADPHLRAGDPAHGRAVRRSRRSAQTGAPPGVAQAVDGCEDDDRLRDARPCRGRDSVRPGCCGVVSAGHDTHDPGCRYRASEERLRSPLRRAIRVLHQELWAILQGDMLSGEEM